MRKYFRKYCRGLKVKYFNFKGFTLLEVLAVIVIMGIIASVAVPSVFATIEKTKEDVCHLNTAEIEKKYEMHLFFENKDHTDVVFHQYLLVYGGKLCPLGGAITYKSGSVQCSLHPKDEESHNEEDADKEVPYL